MSDHLSTEEQLARLAEQCENLNRVVQEQGERLRAIEQQLKTPPAVNSSKARSSNNQSRTQAAADEQAPKAQRVDLENRIGGSWLNRIGIIAVTLGVGFFLKYAFESQWIGPFGRVAAGVLAGLAFLFAAERLRLRGYRSYAHGLAGGGILILYLSAYAAYAYYDLINHLAAFTLMAGVTALAVALAARFDALPIAALGLIGGFLTPLLLSTGVDQQAALFGYVALLDAGVLALAYVKGWRSLNYASFVATALLSAGWMATWYAPPKLFTTLFFLTLFFLIFALIPVLNNIAQRRRAEWLDISLIFGNAAFFYGACYLLLEQRFDAWRSLLALGLAGVFVALGELARRRTASDALLFFTFIGVAITFVTVAIPIQLKQQWVTMAWAAEGAVLTWIGFRAGERTARLWALPIFAVAILHWLGNDLPAADFQAGNSFLPLLNVRAASCAAIIIGLAYAGWLYHRGSGRVAEREREVLRGVLWLTANLLTLVLLSLDAHDYFRRRNLELASQLSLSMIWALYSGAALTVGILKGVRLMRVAALGLLCLTVAKVFFFDLSSLERFYRIGSFILLGAILLSVSFLYQQRQRQRQANGESL